MHLELGTPRAQRVQDAVQRVLVSHDMTASDDMVMAEYVTVMIANHKGLDAIAEELGELVGGDLDPSIPRAIWDAANAADTQETAHDARRSASPEPMREDRAPRARDADRHARVERSERSERAERPAQPARAERNAERAPARGGRDAPRAAPERGRRRDQELFPPKPRGKMQSDAMPELSIFGRAGVPDPHAAPFVPEMPPPPPEVAAMMAAMAQGPSLFSRLDPMMPSNPPVDVQQATDAAWTLSRDPSTFPTRPSETALCRYSIHCTNPQCVYSHPSPANAGKHGDEHALVLSEEACEAGAQCTDKECVKSHVSPAVAILSKRPAAAPAAASTAPPCRFQAGCLNPACTYAHYDARGQLVPPPASGGTPCRFGTRCTRADCAYTHPTKSKTPCRYGDACTRADCIFTHPRDGPARPTADRLKPFAEEGGAMERILPGGQTDAPGEAVPGSA